MTTITRVGIVRAASVSDLHGMAVVNEQAFQGNRGDMGAARRWVHCWFRAYPIYQYFVMASAGKVVGYIGWQVHGGFCRSDPVVELEQVAFLEEYQGKGLGPRLITESLDMVREWMRSEGNQTAQDLNIIVWAYDSNDNALRAYEKTLFADGTRGMRLQYVNRGAELMLRGQMSLNQAP